MVTIEHAGTAQSDVLGKGGQRCGHANGQGQNTVGLSRRKAVATSWMSAHADWLLPSCPGHAHWQRAFNGSASVFSFTFQDSWSAAEAANFLNTLKIFKIRMSWGGVHSLAVVYPNLVRPNRDFGGRLVRLNIGLETPADLIADLEQAMTRGD